MRWYAFVALCVLTAILVAAHRGESAVDVVSFHRISAEGPSVSSFNDGETVYVNASDGSSSGGSESYVVIDGGGSLHSLNMYDNGNQGDTVPNDGFYTGRFTVYGPIEPAVPYTTIQCDNGTTGYVIVDLDSSGGATNMSFDAQYSDFAMWVEYVDDSSDNVHFDNGTKTLYISNDQPGSNTFTVVLRDNKVGAWGKSCEGEAAFGDSPSDGDYDDRQWDLDYDFGQNGTCDGQLTFTVTDRAGYEAYANLTVVVENDPPVVTSLAVSDIPDHIGPLYRWWRPQGLASGLNVTWSNSAGGAPLANASMDWDASIDANDQLGIPCGLDGVENVGGLEDDGSCWIDISVTVRDLLDNSASDSYTIMFDADAPNITTIEVSESHDNVHFNGTLLYSNDDAGMSAPFTFVVEDDEAGSGRSDAEGSPAFGDAPTDDDYVAGGGWDLVYTIHQNEEPGPLTITIAVRDNVGNEATAFVTTRLDNADPVLNGSVSESSPYLHMDGTLFFGRAMPTTQNATFSGTSQDDVGLWKVEFSQEANLAASPATPLAQSGRADTWNGTYGFSSSSTPGDGTIVIRLYDLVGNTDVLSQDCSRDDSPPSITPANYADGRIVVDTDPMVVHGDPWSLRASVAVTDDLTSLHRVDASVDGSPGSSWLEPLPGTFMETSAALNATGWHLITWTAMDHVNNSRTIDTSVLRAPNSTDERLRRQLSVSDGTLVNAALTPTFAATILMTPTSAVWASVMDYPLHPITGYPPGNYTGEANRNYTTFRWLSVGVNRTSLTGPTTVRIYYTSSELEQIGLEEEALLGIARWSGSDWVWLTDSTLSTANETVGGVDYGGYAELVTGDLLEGDNVLCIAGWRYRVDVLGDMHPTNATVFRNSVVRSYEQTFQVTIANIGTTADDYYVNATGPNDWNLSWVSGMGTRRTLRSIGAGERLTLTLYVVIPTGAVNCSAGSSGMGRAYPISVNVASITDTRSAMNPWMDDSLSLTAFIRRTDLELSSIEFSRSSSIEGQELTVFVGVYNHGNYTTEDATLTVTMEMAGNVTVLGTVVLPRGWLDPLQTAWARFPVTLAKDIETASFSATVAYGGDERDIEPNDLEVDHTVVAPSNPAVAAGLPAVTALLLASLAIALGAARRRDSG
ncbi:MAG: hypothetical protein L0Z54_02300 [Thermoplasmata archaeon]|nr:hypothetical protein [Thermoplasmata archaeon]